MNKNVITNVVVGVVGAGVGFASGYFFVKKKFEAYAEEEIRAVRETYQKLRKDGDYSTPEKAREALMGDTEILVEADENDESEFVASFTEPEIEEYNQRARDYSSVEELPASTIVEAETVTINVFDTPKPKKEDLEDMWEPIRDGDNPYVISEEDYMTTEDEWEKLSMTYYEEDGQMVDERDKLLNDSSVFGEDNLRHFGYKAGSKNTLYIRNPRISTDFEIIRDKRSYQEVVLGIKPEKVKNKQRRMREGDDE